MESGSRRGFDRRDAQAFFSNLIFYFPCSRGRAKAHKQHSALMQHAHHSLHSRQVFVFNNALSTAAQRRECVKKWALGEEET